MDGAINALARLSLDDALLEMSGLVCNYRAIVFCNKPYQKVRIFELFLQVIAAESILLIYLIQKY
jgi:hypothetical protein